MSKYLVTGGAGLIGTNLIRFLLDQGHTVYSLDNYSTGFKKNKVEHAKVEYYTGDILNSKDYDFLIDEVDFVFHLASAVGVKTIMDNPLKSIDTILRGSENILSLCREKKKPVLFTSTSEVYGVSKDLPYREDGNVVYGPTTNYRWCYAYAKSLSEMLFLSYENSYIVRLFNVVGPEQSSKFGMVLPSFVEKAVQNKPLRVFGDGQQVRCFCHVKDVVEALYGLSLSNECKGQVFNIGNDEEVSMLDLAKKVIQLSDSQSDVEVIPYSEIYKVGFEDMMKRVPSIKKINSFIGWAPKFSLEQIILDFLKNKKEVDDE